MNSPTLRIIIPRIPKFRVFAEQIQQHQCGQADLSAATYDGGIHAGPVIRYRLRRDILQDLTPGEEERLLEQIYQLPPFVLLQSYVKENGPVPHAQTP